MDHEDFAALLDEVLDCTPAARPALLTEVFASTPTRRQRIEAVLAALGHKVLCPFGSTLGALMQDALRLHAKALPEGTKLGPYRLLRRLGEGGMGDVYLAARTAVSTRRCAPTDSTPRSCSDASPTGNRFWRGLSILG